MSEPIRAQLDLSLLCTALGFFAVIIKEDALSDGSTERALQIARLAEEFCSLEMVRLCRKRSSPLSDKWATSWHCQ